MHADQRVPDRWPRCHQGSGLQGSAQEGCGQGVRCCTYRCVAFALRAHLLMLLMSLCPSLNSVCVSALQYDPLYARTLESDHCVPATSVGCRLRLVYACSAGSCFGVLLACVGGLTLLTCACAFDGFLLSLPFVSTGLPMRLFVTDSRGVYKNVLLWSKLAHNP